MTEIDVDNYRLPAATPLEPLEHTYAGELNYWHLGLRIAWKGSERAHLVDGITHHGGVVRIHTALREVHNIHPRLKVVVYE